MTAPLPHMTPEEYLAFERASEGRHEYVDGYAYASALCGPPEFADGEFGTLLNASVILEVLSDSTEAYHRGDKFTYHRGITALREYVLVLQREARVERFVRGEGGAWVLATFEGSEAVLELPSVDVAIPVAEIYEGVELPPRVPGLRVLRETLPAAYTVEAAQ